MAKNLLVLQVQQFSEIGNPSLPQTLVPMFQLYETTHYKFLWVIQEETNLKGLCFLLRKCFSFIHTSIGL